MSGTLMQGRLGKSGVQLFKFPRHLDERGYFLSLPFNSKQEYYNLPRFVECNVSMSQRGVIRGLHFQTRARAQGKLVTCLQGALLDAFVDLRPESPSFGEHGTYLLEGGSGDALFIPEGFAHGFQALEDRTLLHYHVTQQYEADYQGGIHYADPELGIEWRSGLPLIVSAKDQ